MLINFNLNSHCGYVWGTTVLEYNTFKTELDIIHVHVFIQVAFILLHLWSTGKTVSNS
jgi:hypothetical protein